jgi:glycosyltransferase involved in cell wall biosynthesis
MSASSPLVSILVPTYNAAPYLAELCESIRAQSHQNFEVLILDDGSTVGALRQRSAFSDIWLESEPGRQRRNLGIARADERGILVQPGSG